MSAATISRVEAERTIEVLNRLLKAGFIRGTTRNGERNLFNEAAKELKVATSTISQRLPRIAAMYDLVPDWTLEIARAPTARELRKAHVEQHATIPQRLNIDVPDGVVIVFSDAHYWPGHTSEAHRALLRAIKALRPVVIIANGDMLDGATISRHDPNGWEQRPRVAQELEESVTRLAEVEAAAPDKCELIWCLGNHDVRFERYLAVNAPAMEGVKGMTLAEHFARWIFTMSAMLNPRSASPVMTKHRYANGIHAAYNNTMKAGVSMVTGHLHRLTVTCWGDYRGRRYGVDTGTLAEPHGPQFTYSEDAPSPHGSGFAVLTFVDGDMLPPELVEVRAGTAYFRGAAL